MLKTLKKYLSLIFPLLSFSIPLIIYSLTTARTITSYADSAELTTVAYTFEAAHPPGYPLFIILGKLFTFLPIGTIAFRANLMACFLGALTIYFVYQIFKTLNFSSLSAFLGSQFVAFSYSIWLYAITAEVFVLNNALSAAIIFLSLKWKTLTLKSKISQSSNKYLYLLAFTFGLGLSNHTSIILLSPALFFLALTDPKKRVFKNLHKLIFFFLLGLAPYLHLYFSSLAPHYPNFGNLPGLKRFLLYITRSDFGGFFSGGKPSNIIPEKYWGLTIYYLTFLATRFTPIAPILTLIYIIKGKNKIIPFFLTLCLLFTAFIFPIYAFRGNDAHDLHSLGVVERFGQLGFLMLGIIAILGSDSLFQFIKKPSSYLNIFLLLSASSFLFINYPRVNKSNYNLVKNYALNILNQVEPNSIIISSDDLTSFSLFYFVYAEKFKTDVRVIHSSTLPSIWYQKELKKYWPDLYTTDSSYEYDILRSIIETNQNIRPVYLVIFKDPYPFGFDANPNRLIPMGLILKTDLFATSETIKSSSQIDYWKNYDLSQTRDTLPDPFAQVVQEYYPFRFKVNSRLYISADCLICAQKEIQKGLEYFPENDLLIEAKNLLQTTSPIPKSTAQEYIDSAKTHIESTGFLFELNFHRAVWDLKQAIEIEPENEKAHSLLAELYNYFGAFDMAIKHYQKAAEINPNSNWLKKAEEIIIDK